MHVMSETRRFDFTQLCARISQALLQAGLSPEMAESEARIMVEADLLGVPSHGVRMLPPLLKALAEGRAKAQPEIRLIQQFGATCLMDGDNGPGRSVSSRAMDEAIERAKNFGIGACLAIHTTHWGRAHAYASRAACAGMVGICSTNAMPTMAVWGAKGKVIGNNPLAIGIPRSDAEAPLVLDIAMSQAAVGKVGTWLREGRSPPEGWGLNAAGEPSCDAQEILAGAVLPFGGHKGAGLALMMELLTAALAGGAFGNEIIAGDRSGLDPDACKLFIALNPAAFGGLETLTSRVDHYLDHLDEVAAPFTWPGERGWVERDLNLRAGVPLHTEIIAQLTDAGVRLDPALDQGR
jgi:LDH2 family malate/lactate/ureidoglycolate dehydrogenase